MLRVFSQPALTLTAVLTAIMLLMRVYVGVTTPAPQPFDLFTYPGCDGPCWQGLEIGSSPDDLIRTLDKMGVPQVIDLHTTSHIQISELQQEHFLGPLRFGVHSQQHNSVTNSYYMVVHYVSNDLSSIGSESHLCLTDVIVAYGIPDVIYNPPGDPVALVYNRNSTYLNFNVVLPSPSFTVGQYIFSHYALEFEVSYLSQAAFPDPLVPARWSEMEGYFRQSCSP